MTDIRKDQKFTLIFASIISAAIIVFISFSLTYISMRYAVGGYRFHYDIFGMSLVNFKEASSSAAWTSIFCVGFFCLLRFIKSNKFSLLASAILASIISISKFIYWAVMGSV